MQVYIYDSTGLLETRPESDWAAAGKEVDIHNRGNGGSVRRLVVSASFPPAGHIFDQVVGGIRAKSLQESLNDGELSLPDAHTIMTGPKGERVVGPFQKMDSSGDVVSKTIQELIVDGFVPFDASTQKIQNEQIIPKTRQELLDDAVITLAAVRDSDIQRLRAEIEQHFASAKTTNGYRLDNLARQKAGVSLPFRTVDDADPQKSVLLTSKVIYPNAVTDEILAAVEAVQSAYDQAKAAIEDCFTQSKPVTDFEAIKLSNYLGS